MGGSFTNNRGKHVFILIGMLVVAALLWNYVGARNRIVAQAATLVVPDAYATIQDAIDAASPGDTIVVRPGVYNESLNISKPLTLTAESFNAVNPVYNTTIIDGGSSSATIFVPPGVSPGVTIRGFVIRNGEDTIYPRSEMIIEYNYFVNGVDQIDYEKGSGGINRYNVYFGASDDAIDLDDMNRPLLIEYNRILYSGDDGIEIRLQDLSAPAQPTEFTIRHNQILGCGEDGIQIIDYSQLLDTNRRFIIANNLIANCRYAGIGLMPDDDTNEDYSGADIVEAVRVYNNTLYGNDYGISGGDNLAAFNNLIVNSTHLGVWRVQGGSGSNSVVAHTLFYHNGLDADQSELGAGNLFGQDPGFLSAPHAGADGVWGTVDDDFSGLVLTSGSPAIDAGVTQYTTDSGEAVPPAPLTGFSGSAPDLGWQEFDPDRPPTHTPTSTPEGNQVAVSQVSSSADDAEEALSSGAVDLHSSDLELGADGTTSQIVGLRFPNLDIPHGVYILSAYVEFEVDETGSSTTSVLLQGQASDDAPAFTTSSGNISDRLRTSAQVAWNDIPRGRR